MTLIDGDRIVTAQLYDDQYEEFTEKKMSIIDYVNAYTDEGVTTIDDVFDKIRAEIDEQTEIHSDGEFYIKNIDVKRIINKYRGEQETETWNGIHAQITAPKGTFDKIWEEADEEDYIDDDIERKLEWMEEQKYLEDKYGKESE